MKQDKNHNKLIGGIGEDAAAWFLMKQGFSIIDRNYLRKWGELDIVAYKDRVIHFVEVKTVSRVPSDYLLEDRYRPEDNLHPWKLKRLSRVIQTYLIEKRSKYNEEWQFDVITVFLNPNTKETKINYLEDIVL